MTHQRISIRGYGKFLKANSRYKHFLRAGAENEDAQLSALQTSGYATDPMYAQKLKNIMNGLPMMRRAKGEASSHNPPRASRALPYLWQSECGTYRIIRCCDDIQYIFQRWREPKWRHLSYHVEYDSLVRRWASTGSLPAGLTIV